jgi:hypothetical protein
MPRSWYFSLCRRYLCLCPDIEHWTSWLLMSRYWTLDILTVYVLILNIEHPGCLCPDIEHWTSWLFMSWYWSLNILAVYVLILNILDVYVLILNIEHPGCLCPDIEHWTSWLFMSWYWTLNILAAYVLILNIEHPGRLCPDIEHWTSWLFMSCYWTLHILAVYALILNIECPGCLSPDIEHWTSWLFMPLNIDHPGDDFWCIFGSNKSFQQILIMYLMWLQLEWDEPRVNEASNRSHEFLIIKSYIPIIHSQAKLMSKCPFKVRNPQLAIQTHLREKNACGH